MGELDDKEAAPASNASGTGTPTTEVISVDEPKETETLLPAASDTSAAKSPAAEAAAISETTAAAAAAAASPVESPKSATSTTVTIEKEPEELASPAAAAASGDDKETEKLLPAAAEATAAIVEAAAVSAVTQEGREVKPKKIPIGGIKMPGFFTKSKPKAEGDGADGELLEKNADAAVVVAVDVEAAKKEAAAAAAKAEKVEEEYDEEIIQLPRQTLWEQICDKRIPFPWRKPLRRVVVPPPPHVLAKLRIDAAEEAARAAEDAAAAPKKCLLNAIRLPIANIIPKKLRSTGTWNKAADTEDVELGLSGGSGNGGNAGNSGPHNKAGLASMETLDDSLKDTENGRDVTDKSATIKADDLDTIKLTDTTTDKENKDKKDEAGAAAPAKANDTMIDSIRGYRITADDCAIAIGTLLFFILFAIICVFTVTGHGSLDSMPVRDGKYITAYTTCGPVDGILEDSSFAFRSIPYARPPIGALRFRPAVPIENIEHCWNGTLTATEPGPICAQLTANRTVVGQEDCLQLDVITPHVRYDNPLPVVVMFGADSYTGGSPNLLRPTARFARRNDVIFVRPNFRVGLLGFLALDVLAAEEHPPTSGNYALSDMLAALRWVQLNIAHFGGNPKSVTVFGYRTGATLVSALVTSPLAADLYARAWVSSGSAVFAGKPLAESQLENMAVVRNDECELAKSGDCLRQRPVADLLLLTPAAWLGPVVADLPRNGSVGHEWMVLDGNILKQHPADVWNRQPGLAAKLVIGTTQHVAHSDELMAKRGVDGHWSEDDLRGYIQDSEIGVRNLTEDALQRYGGTYAGLAAMVSDIRTICPLLTIARVQPSVPFYVVKQRGTRPPVAKVEDDVLAILGRYEPKTPEQRRYVSAIQQLFYHYVSHGEMPQFEARRRVMEIGQDALSVEDYRWCDFWIENDFVPRYARIE